MERKHNKQLTPAAKDLRKNMTEEEKSLWYGFLRTYPVHFYRQRVVGQFIADFYCAKAKLIIELDGSQHYEEKGLQYDAARTSFLEQHGLTVIRVPNSEIKYDFNGVCKRIDMLVKQRLTETPQ